MAKVFFYVVVYKTPNAEFEDQIVLTRCELVSFLRKGCKFISIRPLERPDFSNLNLFEQENNNG